MRLAIVTLVALVHSHLLAGSAVAEPAVAEAPVVAPAVVAPAVVEPAVVAPAVVAPAVVVGVTTDPSYFASRRAVAVVQSRRFPKVGRWELAPFVGVIPNDAFVTHLPVGVRLVRHTSEHSALEVGASGTIDLDTPLREHLLREDANLDATVRDRQRARLDLAWVYSPIYGKFAWLNRRVVYVDVSLVAGAGAVFTEGEQIDGAAGIRPELLTGVGLRVFLGRKLSLRFDYRQLVYLRAADGEESGGVATPSELSVGLGLLFGGKR